MPKPSAASLTVATVATPIVRLRPPRDLTPAQALLWRTVVDSLPGDYFGREQEQQLRAYVQHAAMADHLAQRLQATDPMADGWAKLSACQVSHSKAALALARGLRLTNQSRVQPDTAANKAKAGGRATLALMRRNYEDEPQ